MCIMWIKSACELGENTEQISTSVTTHIIARGEKVALFDASVWGLREELFSALNNKVESLDYVFISHAHFDHLGALPFLRQNYPSLKLVAGSQTVKMLSSEAVLENLFNENRESALSLDQEFNLTLKNWTSALNIDLVLNEGDEVDLGDGVVVKAICTPGHSEDSMSYLIRPDCLMVVGDALGAYNGRDCVVPSFRDSLEDFLASILKIESFEVKLLALAHSGVSSGDLVPRFFEDLKASSSEFVSLVKEKLSEVGDEEEVALSIAEEWESELRLPDGPFKNAHKDCVLGMVKAVLK